VPNQQISPEVDYLTHVKGVKKFFLVGSDYVFPRKSFAIAKPLIAKNGASVVGEEYAPIGTTDWSAVVAKMQQSQPDAVFAITVAGSDPVTLMKQLRAAGIEAPVASTVIEETGLKALGADGEGVLMAAAYFEVLNTPENKKFLAALKQRFGKVEPQNLYSTPCYDAVHEYAKAFKDAGNTKARDVLEALAGVEVTGPRGRVTLNRDRHATMPIYLAEGQSDSTFKIIKSYGEVKPSQQCNPEPGLPS
jgi:branched-chain amino acid transport system substrate-binding protein